MVAMTASTGVPVLVSVPEITSATAGAGASSAAAPTPSIGIAATDGFRSGISIGTPIVVRIIKQESGDPAPIAPAET